MFFCLKVKPSPSKKSRSGTAVPRRSCQGGVPSQLHVLCETKAQVTTEADVEQGWCLGWGERNASPVFLSLPSFGMAELSAGHLQVVLQCCFGLFPRGQGWSCGARGSEMSWVGSVAVVTWGWACTTRAGGGAVCASTQVPTSAARISCPGLCRWTKPTAIPSPPLCPPPPWAVGVSTHPQTGEAQGGAQHEQPLCSE